MFWKLYWFTWNSVQCLIFEKIHFQDYIKYLMKQATTEKKNWNLLALQYFCLILLCFTLRNWLANKLLLFPPPPQEKRLSQKCFIDIKNKLSDCSLNNDNFFPPYCLGHNPYSHTCLWLIIRFHLCVLLHSCNWTIYLQSWPLFHFLDTTVTWISYPIIRKHIPILKQQQQNRWLHLLVGWCILAGLL